MKGCYSDLPSDLNHDYFSKTTKKMAITIGPERGVSVYGVIIQLVLFFQLHVGVPFFLEEAFVFPSFVSYVLSVVKATNNI